ncbi:MAG TPA: hypothetical protein VHG11_12655 [Pseudorhizobium sp.]|nr:hypothetical protein [Pseudorhizobium sp.]
MEAVIAVAKHVAAWGGDVVVGRQHPWFVAVASMGFVLLCLLRTRLRLIGLPLIFAAFLLSWQEQRKPMPDMLVSEDGSLTILAGSTPSSNRSRPPSFIFEQWQRAHLLPVPVPPQMSPAGDAPVTPTDPRQELHADLIAALRGKLKVDLAAAGMRPGQFICRGKLWCAAVIVEDINIVTVEDARITGLGCDLAHLVIAPRARFTECRSRALLLSGNVLRKTGALEISFKGSADAELWEADAASLGARRPWTEHRLYDWRSDRFETAIPAPILRLISGSAE